MRFHAGSVPFGYRIAYEPYLFNTSQHQATQRNGGWESFHCLDEKTKKVLASIHFFVSGKKAVSPAAAPFGGFDVSDKLPTNVLFDFIGFIQSELNRKHISFIEIKNAPEAYSSWQPLINTFLINHGFQISVAEPGACISVNKTPLEEKMSRDKRSRLRQCRAMDFTFKKIPLSKLTEVYTFIAQCRAKQARTLSLSLADLSRTVEALPKSFFQVGIYHKTKLINACICVRVKSDIVYTFYSAHDPAYDHVSPRVFLLTSLYEWCAANHIKLIDLGTSALEGKPNFPLLDFKQRMGALITPKYTFTKNL